MKITSEPVNFDVRDLDSQGNKVFQKWCGSNGHESVMGIATLAWKSPEDREQCVKYQKGKSTNTRKANRWEDVKHYARHADWKMELRDAGPGPVFIHPNLTDSQKLKPVKGARRIMAHVKSGHASFKVIVLRAIAESPS